MSINDYYCGSRSQNFWAMSCKVQQGAVNAWPFGAAGFNSQIAHYKLKPSGVSVEHTPSSPNGRQPTFNREQMQVRVLSAAQGENTMDTYNKEKKIYVINGKEYSEAVALSYMQTICGFSEQETKEYLELLASAEHQAVAQKAL